MARYCLSVTVCVVRRLTQNMLHAPTSIVALTGPPLNWPLGGVTVSDHWCDVPSQVSPLTDTPKNSPRADALSLKHPLGDGTRRAILIPNAGVRIG
jgi:hypothetical protein